MNTYDSLFMLLRYGIGNSAECNIKETINWPSVYYMSCQQGVAGVILDGIDRCYSSGSELSIDVNTKLEWIGAVQQMESVYAQQKKVVDKLAEFYRQNHIRMMLLKGIGLSYDYPVPNHRPCGDIDIYLFGDLGKGDFLVERKYGVTIDKDHHKHTVFEIDGVTVENHYDFANYHKHRSSRWVDVWLKEEANSNFNNNAKLVLGNNVHLPSASFNAVFLVRHAASHFAAEQITLRHLLDWAFFVEKHHDEVDWEWQWKVCQEQNMHQFLLAINDICVQYLGFDRKLFKTGGNQKLTTRVLNDILNPEFTEDNPHGTIAYIWSRGRRWWANRWKHRIVYPEGLLSTFVNQVGAHLMKPATFSNKSDK